MKVKALSLWGMKTMNPLNLFCKDLSGRAYLVNKSVCHTFDFTGNYIGVITPDYNIITSLYGVNIASVIKTKDTFELAIANDKFEKQQLQSSKDYNSAVTVLESSVALIAVLTRTLKVNNTSVFQKIYVFHSETGLNLNSVMKGAGVLCR